MAGGELRRWITNNSVADPTYSAQGPQPRDPIILSGRAPLDWLRRAGNARPSRFTRAALMPLYSDVSVFLCKPFVKGLAGNPFQGRMFNDAWIDTNWRP